MKSRDKMGSSTITYGFYVADIKKKDHQVINLRLIKLDIFCDNLHYVVHPF